MQGISEMRTWQTRGRRSLVLAVMMAAIAVALIGSVGHHVWRRSGQFWTTGASAAFASVLSWENWRHSKRRTTASPQGVETFDGFQARRVEWAEVRAIHPSRYESVVELKLDAGEPMHLFGVTPEDVPELMALRDSVSEPPA